MSSHAAPGLDPHSLIYSMMMGSEAAVEEAVVESAEVKALADAVRSAGDAVAKLKVAKAPKPEVEAAVAALLAAKKQLGDVAPDHSLIAKKKPAAKAAAVPAAAAEGEVKKKPSKKDLKRAGYADAPKKEKDPNRWAVDPVKAAAKAAKLLEKEAGKAAAKDEPDTIPQATILGQKKKLALKMTATYESAAVEKYWQEWWEASGWYGAKPEDALNKKPDEKFVMVIPPPNVTGSLHLGHALTAAIEDGLTRWHRMRGDVTLYVPGTDHAGIATQSVVEKQLAKEGLTRHDLGREKFIERVWEWKDHNGSKICKQLRRLGSSVDWSRERFTMDATCARAVTEAFARLSETDTPLLYRANRLVNWSPALRTAISDVEVDQVEVEGTTWRAVPNHTLQPLYEFGTFTHFAYEVLDSEGGALTGEKVEVATTRLETMLGDAAVAVHPEDPKYKHLHGAFLRHPFFPDRPMRVITDSILVDMDKGTGCVKVTPAHDANDYECGKRHKLPFVTIFTLDGAIVDGVDWPVGEKNSRYEKMPAFCAGLMRYDARVAIESKLKVLGLMNADEKISKESKAMQLNVCSRSGDIIEPLVQPQWFVDCESMAQRSCDAVRDGSLKIVPKEMEKVWFKWLENIRPWCVSRQLWWGHRIPAWFCRLSTDKTALDKNADANVSRWIVARDVDEARKKAVAKFGDFIQGMEQDEDVLDTWFSSGLFPFAVFGWPEQTPDLKAFYPTTLLETGQDILFFWVARMVMLGLQLTDVLPFTSVYLHAMVRDKENRKMSKSLGNVIDPLEIINGCTLSDLLTNVKAGNLKATEVEKASSAHTADFPDGIPTCGSDALRIGLLAYTVQGRDINLDIKRVVGYRSFCNKLWNAVRFVLGCLSPDFLPTSKEVWATLPTLDLKPRDKFMLSRLAKCVEATNRHFTEYLFGAAVQDLYTFFLNDLCDVYVELVKPVIYSKDPKDDAAKLAASYVLWASLDCGLRLLHPFCPFVTEELWQRLPRSKPEEKSIMVAPYPSTAETAYLADEPSEAGTRLVLACVAGARSLRAANSLNKPAEFKLKIRQPALAAAFTLQKDDFNALARSDPKKPTELIKDDSTPQGCAAHIVDEHVTVYVGLAEVDVSAEIAKLEKQHKALAPLLKKLVEKLEPETEEGKEVLANYIMRAKEGVYDKEVAKLASYKEKMKAIDDGMKTWNAMKKQ